MLRGIAIEQRQAGQKNFTFDEVGAAQAIRRASIATGTKQTDLVAAIDTYSAMGDGARGLANIDRIARQGKLLGGASNVAKLRAQMDISSGMSGQNLSEDEKDQIIAQMHFLGKQGVFRAEDMAAQSEEMFSRFAASGMDFRTGMGRYVQFANLAKTASGSPEKSRTNINAVQNQIAKKEGALRSLGVKTRNEDGSHRDFIDVVIDSIEKTGGEGAFLKIFDPSKSGVALSPLVQKFQAAERLRKTTGKGPTGREAVEQLLQGALPAGMTGADLVKDMHKDEDKQMEGTGEKIAQAKERIKASIEDALIPVLEKLADKMPQIVKAFEAAAKHFSTIISFVEKHPALSALTLGAGGALGGIGVGAAKGVAGAAARFLGDSLVNTVPRLGGGIGGKLLGGALGAVGGAIGQIGSTPVYITGVAAGVSLGGGGGLGGLGGALPGGLLGGGGAAMSLGTAAAGAGIAVGLVAWMAMINDKLDHPNRFGGSPDDTATYREATDEEKDEWKRLQKKKQDDREDMTAMLGGQTGAQMRAGETAVAEFFEREGTLAKPDKTKLGKEANFAPLGNTSVGSGGVLQIGPAGTATDHAVKQFAAAAADATKQLQELASKAGGASKNVSLLKVPPLP